MMHVDSSAFQIDDSDPRRTITAAINFFFFNASLANFLSSVLGDFLDKILLGAGEGTSLRATYLSGQVTAKGLFQQNREWLRQPQRKTTQAISLLILLVLFSLQCLFMSVNTDKTQPQGRPQRLSVG